MRRSASFWKRRFAFIVVAAGLCFLATAWPAALANPVAADPPTITIAPSDGLLNGQFVRVSWTGFKPLFPVYLLQCIADPHTVATDCTTNTQNGVAYFAYSLDDRTGSLFFPVSTGTYDAGFTCDENNPCSVAVTPSPNSLTKAVVGVITFDPSPASCPPPSGPTLLGSGEEAANQLMQRWEVHECSPPDSLDVEYTKTSSPVGRDQFASGLADFATTGDALTADQIATLDSRSQTYAYAPMAASSVVLAYSIYDIGSDGTATTQVFDVNLTADNVAKILTKQINNLRIPDIEANNPDAIHWDTRSIVYGMGYASAANFELTSWLWATDNAYYSSVCSCTGPSNNFPPILGINLVSSDDLIGSNMANPLNDHTSAYFGWMDASTAAFYGLPTAKIQNANGEFVPATPDSVAASLAAAGTDDNGVTVTPNYTTPVAGAYPMPFVSYMLVPTNTIDPAKGDVLRTYLSYGIGDGQSNLPIGYVPLSTPGIPGHLLTDAQDAIDAIPSASNPSPSPTPSPSPSHSPSPSPSSTTPSTTGLGGGTGSFGSGSGSFGSTPIPSSSSAVPLPCSAAPGVPGPGPTSTPTTSPGTGSGTPTAAPSSPSASPTTTSAGATPTAKPTVQNTPTAGPTSAPTPSAAPSPCPETALAVSPSPGQIIPGSVLSSPAARLILPALLGLGVLGLALGPALQFAGRKPKGGKAPGAGGRRRWIPWMRGAAAAPTETPVDVPGDEPPAEGS